MRPDNIARVRGKIDRIDELLNRLNRPLTVWVECVLVSGAYQCCWA